MVHNPEAAHQNSSETAPAVSHEQMKLLVYFFRLGTVLHDQLEKHGLLESLSARYQAPGKNRITTAQAFAEINRTHPAIVEAVQQQAALLNFSFSREKDWETIVSQAMRIAGAKSGHHYSTAELNIIFDNVGKLTDKQIALLLPGRTEATIYNLRRYLDLPSTMQLWTDDEEEKVRQYVEEGLTDKEIAQKLGTRTEHAVSSFRTNNRLLKNYWDDDRNEMLRELVAAGLYQYEMAEHMEVSLPTIKRHLIALGLQKEHPTPEDVKEMRRLGRNGYSVNEIGELLGFSWQIIDKQMRRQGYTSNTFDQWSEWDAAALADGYRQNHTDEEIAAQLNRPVWQVKLYKFRTYGFRFVDTYEAQLVWLSEYEGVYQPLAIYLRDQAKMSLAEIDERFHFTSSASYLSKSLSNYLEKGGELRDLPITHWKRMDILELHSEGLSAKKISKIINRAHGSIHQIIRNAFAKE